MSEPTNLNDLDLNSISGVTSEASPTPAPAAAPVSEPLDSKSLARQGSAIYSSLSKNDKDALSSNSGKVHFLNVLVSHKLPAKIAYNSRTVVVNEETGETRRVCDYKDGFGVVGVRFKTDIDLDVPNIPFVKPPQDTYTLTPMKTILSTLRHVSAGETFDLTRVEAMYLMVMPEYKLNGYVAYGDDEAGVQLAAKAATMSATDNRSKTAVMPTPVFKKTTKTGDNGPIALGSIKDSAIEVDRVDSNGAIVPVNEAFATKFAALWAERGGSRSSDGLPATKARQGTLASLAIYKILNQ